MWKRQLESSDWINTCLKLITNKDHVCSTWNSAQCYVAAWMGGQLGENGYIYIYIYVWLSSFAVHLKLSSHCLLTGYTPLQIKSLITSKHMISNSFLGRNGKLHKFRYHIQIIIKVRQIEDIIYFIHQYKAKITKFHLKIFLVGQTLTFYQALHLSASSSSLQPVSFSITLY